MTTKKRKTLKNKIKTILEDEKIINLDNLREFLSKLKIEYFTPLQTNKQDKLIAGNNIIIAADGKTISADVSSEGYVQQSYVDTHDAQTLQAAKDYTDDEIDDLDSQKQDNLTTTQLDAVNSGINSTKVAQIQTNADDIEDLQTDKQDKLTTTQLDAVNSGINSTKVAQIQTNADDIEDLQTDKQDKLTAGANISISSNNVISAMGTFSDLPVGFTIQTMVDFDPSYYFGGDWLQITGKILRADDNTDTGGSDEYSLTIDQMPSHRHSLAPKVASIEPVPSYIAREQALFDSRSQNTFYTDYKGGGNTFENLPSYQNIYTYTKISLDTIKKDGIKIREK